MAEGLGVKKLLVTALVCAVGAVSAMAGELEPVLRLGVTSDIHLKTGYDTKKADAVLAACAKREVDGMMVLGDITDYGLVPELRLFGTAWDRAFPGDRTPSGKTCEKLFIYGDHDMCGTIHKRMPDAHVKPYGTRADVERLVIRNYGAAKAWKEVFHEDWRHIRMKTVKGYDFILASYSEGEADNKLGNRTSGLDKHLATFKTDPAKPFFFLQHRMFRETVPMRNYADDGFGRKVLSRFPNCFGVFGHHHMSAMRETMLWQDDALTVLDVPSISYLCYGAEYENWWCKKKDIPAQMPMLSDADDAQYYVMNVFPDRIVVERWEAFTDKKIGPDWVVPVGPGAARPFSDAAHGARFGAPAFNAKWVKVHEVFGRNRTQTYVKRGTDQLVVTFPVAKALGKAPRAFDYVVTPEVQGADGNWTAGSVVKKVLPPGIDFSPELEKGLVTCVFDRREVPYGKVRIKVVPRNDSFGPLVKEGEPIYSEPFVFPGGAEYAGGIISHAAYAFGGGLEVYREKDSAFRFTARAKGEVSVRPTKTGYVKRYKFDLVSQKDQSVIGELDVAQSVEPGKVVLAARAIPSEPGKYAFHWGSDNFAGPITFRFDEIENSTVTTCDADGRMRMNLMVPHEKFDPEMWDLNGGGLKEIVFATEEKEIRLKAGADSVLSFLRYKPKGLEASFRAVVKNPRHVTPWDRTMQYSLEITEEYFGSKGRNGK